MLWSLFKLIHSIFMHIGILKIFTTKNGVTALKQQIFHRLVLDSTDRCDVRKSPKLTSKSPYDFKMPCTCTYTYVYGICHILFYHKGLRKRQILLTLMAILVMVSLTCEVTSVGVADASNGMTTCTGLLLASTSNIGWREKSNGKVWGYTDFCWIVHNNTEISIY